MAVKILQVFFGLLKIIGAYGYDDLLKSFSVLSEIGVLKAVNCRDNTFHAVIFMVNILPKICSSLQTLFYIDIPITPLVDYYV